LNEFERNAKKNGENGMAKKANISLFIYVHVCVRPNLRMGQGPICFYLFLLNDIQFKENKFYRAKSPVLEAQNTKIKSYYET